MKLFSKKPIQLGKGYVMQYTIFEYKRFGGIWIYNWHTIDQIRFHTHAFNSYAFLLKGSYEQEVLRDGVVSKEKVDKWMKPRYLPMDYCHRILKAKPSTWTIVFFGKWKDSWWEYFEDTSTWVKYGWGRKVIKKVIKELTDV